MHSEEMAVCETARILGMFPEARLIISRCVVSFLCHNEIQSDTRDYNYSLFGQNGAINALVLKFVYTL